MVTTAKPVQPINLGHFGQTIDTNAVISIFGIHRNTVTKWVKAGKLKPVTTIGTSYFFSWDDLRALAKERGVSFFDDVEARVN